MDRRRIVHVGVVHRDHEGVNTGLRFMTLAKARIEVDVVLDDGSIHWLALITSLRRGVRKKTKIEQAEHDFALLVGLEWREVERVAGRIQFFPQGREWGITRSSEARWFSCFCGGSIQVDKQHWQAFQAGEPIVVECPFCTLTRTVSKDAGK